MYRDQIKLAQRLVERQQVVCAESGGPGCDRLCQRRRRRRDCVQVFFVRRGKLIGRESFILPDTKGDDPAELLASFMRQFYDEAARDPTEILLPLSRPAPGDHRSG